MSLAEELVLIQGEQKSLPKSQSVWVESGAVIRVDEGTRGDVLRALKAGQSELRIDGRSLDVQVLSVADERTRKKLKALVQRTLQLQLELHDGQVFIGGKLSRLMDYEQLISACDASDCHYKMSADIPDNLFSQVEELVNHRLQLFSLPKMRLDRGDYLTVHIPVKSTMLKPIQKSLGPMGISVETSTTAIELAPLVRVQITVAEVKRKFSLAYGIKWPSSYNAQILPNFSGVTDPQSLTASFIESNGFGRVLASPNILCRSGKDAEFTAGGEFPIKIMNYRVQDVVWKRYGILLKVSPLADYSGRMSISVETEVSSIDKSQTVDGLPALFTNRVQTHFDLTKPRTIALSGLIKSEDGKNSDGLPGLAELPIIGPLFSSRDFLENRSELVIFVRPEIVSPEADGDEPSLPLEIQSLAKKEFHERP